THLDALRNLRFRTFSLLGEPVRRCAGESELMTGIPAHRHTGSPVNHPPDLPFAHHTGREAALTDLRRDAGEDVGVFQLFALEFGVAAGDELLEWLRKVLEHLADDALRLRPGQARCALEVLQEIRKPDRRIHGPNESFTGPGINLSARIQADSGHFYTRWRKSLRPAAPCGGDGAPE